MAAELPNLTVQQFLGRLERAGSCPGDEVVERLFRHYQLLREWAPRASLIGPGSATHAVERHYAESLAAARWIPDGVSLVDIGSGAGFPGWVLAAATNALVTLTESRSRKVAFLRRAAREAKLSLRVLHDRVIKPLPEGVPEELDCLTLRAVSLPASVWSELIDRLAPRGYVIHWAGEEGWQPQGPLRRVDVLSFQQSRTRRIVLYEKIASD